MSLKLFKYILVITNLILIVLPIVGIVSSYFFLWPRFFTDLENELKLQTLAFCSWGLILILTSICFIGVAFTHCIALHLIAALLLCCPLALGVWLVVEQFTVRSSPNWLVASIAATASVIWAVQVLTELVLACALCCAPAKGDKKDKKAKKEKKAKKGKKGHRDDLECCIQETETKEDVESMVKVAHEVGTADEKEKLVICVQESASLNQGAFVPSPQAPPIQEVDEDVPDEEEEAEEEEEEDEEPDSQARESTPQPPQELPLHHLPEERQQLLPSGTHQCPLATPEDTGV
ncbi:hypothetical protein HDE_10687 [Halotydeus destructor]|nr:hypothetical protein HDE_10687 [Halotydeus destructor]